MKLSILLFFFSAWLYGSVASELNGPIRPYTIQCFENGLRFLKRHINWNFFKQHKLKKLSWSGQLFQWRLHGANELSLDGLRSEQFNVRVLLAELKNEGKWVLESNHGFILSDLAGKNEVNLQSKKVVIGRLQNQVFLNRRNMASSFVLKPIGKTIVFDEDEFQGSLLIVIFEGRLILINKLEIEDYIYSVLRTESWPGWPLEVNKAFAIASRSYAVAKVLEGIKAKNKKPYHFKNTNIHQTYCGFHINERLKQAVYETEGIILAYNRQPVLAMFDSCCGGIIPAKLSTIDFKKAPYLARTEQCSFCRLCKIYQWKLEIEKDDFKKILAEGKHQVHKINDIYVSEMDDAGAVQEICIQDDHKRHTIAGKDFYSMLKKVNSFCYSIKKEGEMIVIEGRGYGHHLGICQWGARAMVDHGFNYTSILKFYYPGTSFMKIALK